MNVQFIYFEFKKLKLIVWRFWAGFKYSMMLFRSYVGNIYIYMPEGLEWLESVSGAKGKASLKL